MAHLKDLKKKLKGLNAAIKTQESLRELLGPAVTDAVLKPLEAERSAVLAELRALADRPEGSDDLAVPIADADARRENLDRPISSGTATVQLTRRVYLQFLFDRHRFLELKGMGISDRVPLRLPLLDVYIPLKGYLALPVNESPQYSSGGIDTEPPVASVTPKPILQVLSEKIGIVVLGDPGAGKTTFLKYVTLMLAVNRGSEIGLEGRLPILISLSAFANFCATNGSVTLEKFVHEDVKRRVANLSLLPIFHDAMREGTALFMLDGLDEIHDLHQRHVAVQAIEDFFTFHSRTGNKLLITSRTVGYHEVRPSVDGLTECTLQDFNDEDVVEFITRWNTVLERAASDTGTEWNQEELGNRRREMILSVQGNPGVRRLASNPMLLTIIALMKRQGVLLPERRVELYDTAVVSLIKYWNLARGLDRVPTRSLDMIEMVRVFAPLALWMQQASPGRGQVSLESMKRKLVEVCADRDIPDPTEAAERLLLDVREYSGLLIERGFNEYSFLHLTFQEYLAAIAIAASGQEHVDVIARKLLRHIGEAHWQEVILLTIGYIGIVQQRDEAAGRVLEIMIREAGDERSEVVAMAGEAVVDAMPGGIVHGFVHELVELLTSCAIDIVHTRPPTRVRAARSLGQLGDRRAEVLDVDYAQYCWIPAGPFTMGDPAVEIHDVDVPYGYWMGRFPVTRSQFEQFALDGGYETEDWWTKAGLEWQRYEKVSAPPRLDQRYALPNAPAVAITWHEAVAYGRWLSARLRSTGDLPNGLNVRLPTEVEWEKAARGGHRIPERPTLRRLSQLTSGHPPTELAVNPIPLRAFSWGDHVEPLPAPCEVNNVRLPAPVGCFPDGSSVYGCEDLHGNVWEWLQTQWGPNWAQPAWPLPPTPDSRDRLEADDEVLRLVRGGSHLVGGVHNQENYRHLTVYYRTRNGPDVRHRTHGFRLCVGPPVD